MSYGQTESFGAMGIECREQQGYHRNDLNYFLEIADPDADGNGELIYTTLTREVMPLIRYRSTDITRLVNDPCACGLPVNRIGKIRARCDEMVVCGMGNVGPWVFSELLRDVQGAGAEWQAIINSDGRRDVIELHVETQDLAAQHELEGIVLANLRERFSDFWKNREMKLYELRVVACGLELGVQTGTAGRRARGLHVDVDRARSAVALGVTGADFHIEVAVEVRWWPTGQASQRPTRTGTCRSAARSSSSRRRPSTKA